MALMDHDDDGQSSIKIYKYVNDDDVGTNHVKERRICEHLGFKLAGFFTSQMHS